MRTLLVHCHPIPDNLSAVLNRAVIEALTHAGHELRAMDLHAEGFNPILSREEREAYLVNPQLIEARVQPHVVAWWGVHASRRHGAVGLLWAAPYPAIDGGDNLWRTVVVVKGDWRSR